MRPGQWGIARAGRRRAGVLFGGTSGERGALIIIAAMLLTLMAMATALSLDISGRVAELRRDQAVADLAALDASRALLSNPALVSTFACASAYRNHANNATCSQPGYSEAATAGTYVSGAGFSPGGSNNAVSVTVTTPYHDFFGGTSASLSRTAVATSAANGQFAIGSTLLNVQAGLGSAGIHLTAVGYRGLATGNVTLGALATQLGFAALTPDQVLTSSVSLPAMINASAALLGNGTAAGLELTTLAGSISGSLSSASVQVGQALGLKAGTGVGLGTTVNLLQAVSGSVVLANQAGLTANLGANLAGTAASVSVTAIVPPTVSPYGPVAVTKATNTQVTVSATVGPKPTSGQALLDGLPLAVSLHPLTLGVAMTLGAATGTLDAIDCTGVNPTDIKLGTVFKTADLNVSAQINVIDIGNVALSGDLLVSLGSPPSPGSDATVAYPTNLASAPVPPGPATVTAKSTGSATVSGSITGSALPGDLLPLLAPNVGTLMTALLQPIALTLFTGIGTTTGSLGIQVGSTADYLGIKVSCPTPQLVHGS